MLYALSDKLKKISTVRAVLLLALFFTAMYIILNGQPFGIAELNERFSDSTVLDSRSSYTPEEAYKLFEALGQEGRYFYARIILLLDFAFPLSYALFCASAISFLLTRLLPGRTGLMRINLVPVATGLVDYVENILLLDIVFTYPKQVNIVAVLANYMTVAKNFLMWFSLILLLLAFIFYIGKVMLASLNK
jgi:hypothetical protein